MKTAGVADLKAHLSRYLAAVKAGDEVQVTERGTPIARICPLTSDVRLEAGLRELERAGLIRRPTAPLDLSFLDRPRPKDPHASVRAALETEREEGW